MNNFLVLLGIELYKESICCLSKPAPVFYLATRPNAPSTPMEVMWARVTAAYEKV